MALVNLVEIPAVVVGIPVVIVQYLGQSDAVLGAVQAVLSVGGLAGGALAGRSRHPLSERQALGLLMGIAGLCATMGAALWVPPLACGGVALCGFGVMAAAMRFNVWFFTRLQTVLPQAQLGRVTGDHHLDRKHFQHGRGCSGFKPPDSYQKAISQYPIVRRRGSCHRSPWKDGARYRRGTKLYPRDRSIGRYFRQGVSVYGGLFGLFPYDTGISGQYDATAHIQYGPATVPNRMDFLHLGATPLVHEGTGESSSI